MGVPKFYRWISERFPCLSEVVKEYQIPEFDNLYLDMNGIVHICSHPEDDNPHFRITEEKIFKDIFHYIEVLFRMIKPKKVFYMAVDGVAPRAKMNQQRGRRFRSAREAEALVEKALEKGEVLPTEERFDSNCITPGTKFMVKLQEQLKYFVINKVSTDKLWQGPRIYLSGHETPGEGEHKIMDFIRHERAKPEYDADTRHCLYGLDADLIMLGMVSHDPHFSLLREEVRFGGKNSQKRSNAPEQTTFHLLHLQLLREYLDFEFGSLRKVIPFPYDLECIIDDWVLMGFLVGNDFIPHLPTIHIHGDALPLLWKTYKEVLPTLDGYLNESGKLNLPRFEKYMKKLAEHDSDQFRDTYADLKWLDGKMTQSGRGRGQRQRTRQGKKKGAPFNKLLTANQYMTLVKYKETVDEVDNRDGTEESSSNEGMDLTTLETDLGVAPLEEAEIEEEEEEEEVEAESSDDEDSMFRHEFRHHKDGYYMEKLRYEHVTPQILRDQAEGYVRAIQWILYYYYDGVPSWSWYYPHHYAPYISDVKNFSDLTIEFDLGTPFLPFEQLMAVLPAASRKNLPDAFHALMTQSNSAIIDYYPTDFETDLNGKMQEWEAVVLIPFIDENRLLKAMHPLYKALSVPEAARNVHGPHFLYEHSQEVIGTYPSSLPGQWPDIVNHHAKVTEVPKDGFVMQRNKLRKGLCPGVKLDTYFPGFPTLKHIPHKAHLEKCGVVVFQQASRNENTIVEIEEKEPPDIEQVATEYLGRSIFVNWPHLEEARVVAVSDGEVRYSVVETSSSKQKPRSAGGATRVETHREALERDGTTIWNKECDSITERYKSRKGVDVGYTHLLLYACPMTGRKYICGHHGNITLEKQWSAMAVPYCLQATVKDLAVDAPDFQQYQTLDQLFPTKADVFMLGSPHYGCLGQVVDIEPKNDGRVRVDFTILQKPALDDVIRRERNIAVQYLPGYVVAQRVGLSGHLISRITGTVYVTRGSRNFQSGKANVGLNLKFSKKNEEVVGYTKRVDGQWLYSQKTIMILQDYVRLFSELFDFVSQNSNNEDGYFEQDIFGEPEEDEDRLKELTKWLKELPCTKVGPSPCGGLMLDEHVVAAIEKEIDCNNEVNRKRKKHIKMQVRPHLLYRPLAAQTNLVADVSAEYELYDRVVNTREGYSVPLGLCGTVIGIHPAEKVLDTVYEVLFDEPFIGGLQLRCSPNRGYQVPPSALINLSHGERKEQAKAGFPAKPMAVVKPQSTGYSGQSDMFSGRGAPSGKNYHHGALNGGGRHGRGGGPSQGPSGHSAQEGGRQSAYQQLLARNKPQGHDLGRRPAPTGSQKDEDNHANFWQQLQGPPPGAITKDTPKRNAPQNTNQNNASQRTPASQPKAGRHGQQNHAPVRMAKESNTHERQAPQGAAQQQGKPTPPSLAEAALALGKLPVTPGQQKSTGMLVKDPVRSKLHGGDEDAIHGQSDEFLSIMNSLEISAKPAAKKQSADPAVIVSSSKPKEDLTITDMEVDQIQIADQQNKEGTAALYQMLKIGQPSKDSEHPPPGGATSMPEHNPKSYGKQVSVHELFQGAKQQKAESGPPQQNQPPLGQRQPVPGMAAPGIHQQGPPPHHANKRSRVTELKQWSSAMGMPPPRYDYTYGPDKRVSAVVSLANGLRFQGSLARNPDQAAESAASHVLLSMQQQQKGPAGGGKPPFLMTPPRVPSVPGNTSISAPPPQHQHQPNQHQQRPRGTFCSSPNSAFTPVIPTGKGVGPPQYHASNQRFANPQQQGGMPNRHPFQAPQRGMGPHQGHHPGQGHHQGQGQHIGPHQGQHQGHHMGQGQHPGWGPGPRHQNRMPHHANQHVRAGPPPPPPPTNQHPHAFNKGQQPGKAHGSWDRWPQPGQGHGGPEEGQRDRKHPESERRGETEHPKTPSKNPFVPLQVMRQQKTPQRETKPEKDAASNSTPDAKKKLSTSSCSTQQEQSPPDASKTQPDAGNAQQPSSNPTTPRDKTRDSASKAKKPAKSPGTAASGAQQRKGRKRLAANFGTAN